MSDEKTKYKPIPKTDNPSGRAPKLIIDLKKLREMYVDGPDYRLTDFLNRHQFNPSYQRSLFTDHPGMFQEWKREWTKRQITNYDEDLTPEILSTTKLITIQRIAFVKDWTKRAQNLKALFDMTMRTHYEAFEHDIRNADLIRSGAVTRRSILTIEDIQTAGGAALRLQELEQRSLLVVGDPDKLKALEQQTEDEIDDSREIVIKQIGKEMRQDEATQLMASYFDQFAQTTPAEQITIEAKPDAETDQV